MAKPQPTDISIEDFDHRCQEIFPDSQERCWGLAVKVIRMYGQPKAVCLAHYEKWLEDLKAIQLRQKG